MPTSLDIREALVANDLLGDEQADIQIARWTEEAGATDDTPGDDLIRWLIEQELVTDFQGEALLAGHTGPFSLGPYRVSQQIAHGRLGGVFRGVHEDFGQSVSLKVFPLALRRSPELMARMGREARIAAEMDHANVVRSFEVGKIGDMFYLAMEPLSGLTLEDQLLAGGPLPFKTACRIIRDVGKGLQHMHDNEIVHRDIRPANIWLTEDTTPKLMEFGASVDSMWYLDQLDEAESIGKFSEIASEFDYMAPEQAYDARCADAISDVYALGATLFHCLTGRPPFVDNNPIRLVLKHVYEALPRVTDLVDDVPSEIEKTLDGMMAKDAQQRFQKMDDVIWALDQFAEEPVEEHVVVQSVSPQYLAWVEQHHPPRTPVPSDDAEGATPELVKFLHFLDDRSARLGKRRGKA